MSKFLILCLYIDDWLITGNGKKEFEYFTSDLSKEFEMYDLGNISFLLGIEFYESSRGLILH